MNGLDMSMVPLDFSFTDLCISLAKKDVKFKERVDDAVRRILHVKEKLGLWSHSSLYPVPEEINKIGNDKYHEFNLEASQESIILAKNDDNILPLTNKVFNKILPTGPTANLMKVLNGGWTYSWQGWFAFLFFYYTVLLMICSPIHNELVSQHIQKVIKGLSLANLL